jgi:hypothetical protein
VQKPKLNEQVHVRRYQPSLSGVVLAHSNLQFLERSARIQADSPFAIANVGFDATIWSPEIGMKLSACAIRLYTGLIDSKKSINFRGHH